MRAHGLIGRELRDVTRAILVSKLTYASPVWFGFLNENRCQAVLNRLKRSGYLGEDFESFVEICGWADEGLFRAAVNNPFHVMHQLLPPERDTPYHLRPRAHNMHLPATNNFLKKNFIHRMLYMPTFINPYIYRYIYIPHFLNPPLVFFICLSYLRGTD